MPRKLPQPTGLTGRAKPDRRQGAPPVPQWFHHSAVAAGLLLLLVIAAYLPAMRGGYIWDDDEYVTDDPLLTASHGLHDIWFSTQAPSQYCPLVYTTFRYERMLWGPNPAGYHLVNILLHGVNAILVWILLRRLAAPGAWLAAAIFAVHPVQVETVAWISELKNIESLLFYLLAVLSWIKFLDQPGRRGWMYYGLALMAGVLALFAKTTACTLPAALVLVLWLRGERIFSGPRVLQILPFLFAGLGMGLLTIWWEKHLGDYKESFDLAFTWPERCLIASRALWFYAGKLIWPLDLTICYPLWRINARDLVQYIPGAACLVVAGLLWAGRKKIGRGVLAGIVFFVAALFPTLGFIIEGAFHYTYVADHYAYTAVIGLVAVFAGLVWHWFGTSRILPLIQIVLLLPLCCLTWRQCGPYHDPEALWRDNLAKNPNSYVGHLNLGNELFKQGRLDEALEQFRAAVTLHPGGDHEQANLGTALLEKGLYAEAIPHLQAALAVNPQYMDAENSLGLAYSRAGDDDAAVTHFRQALKIQPKSLGVMMNLGSTLHHEGKLEEAAEDYQTATNLFPDEVEPVRHLAKVLVEERQFIRATEAWQQAVRLAPDRSDFRLELGNLYLAQTNYAEAEKCYLQAVKIDPTSAGLHYNLGIVRGLQGQRDAERQELMESLRLNPNFSPAQRQLMLLSIRQTN